MDDPPKRRQSPRVNAVFRVRYRDLDSLVVAYSQNLSRGGIFVRTARALPINSVIRLMLALPDEDGEIPVIARVAYVRPATDSPPQAAGMGLEFLDGSREALDSLSQYVEARTRHEAERSGAIRLERGLRVLIVDDEEPIRERAAAPFRDRGDQVVTATDGLDALGKCLAEPPDVVVTDVTMPRMDGWTLLRVLRARPTLASVPILFLTGLAGEDERLRGYQLGVDDYISKPVAPGELVARVLRAVARIRRSPADETSKRTLRGDLEQVSLPSLLSFLQLERQTGVLLVVASGMGRLYVRDGQPVAVEIDPAPPGAGARELAEWLLSWKGGRFEFAAQDVSRADQIGVSMQQLILDHARSEDEKR